MNDLLQELKQSYKVPIIIFVLAIILVVGLRSRAGLFENAIVFDLLIVILPLIVSVVSFIVSRMYGNSKIFGRSYFLLGLGFFSVFIGEFTYFIFYGVIDDEILEMAAVSFIASYSFTMAHIIINIKYFAEKIEFFQKMILVLIPLFIILAYSYLVYENSYDFDDFFYYNLMFVTISAVNLGFVMVGFTLFRKTVLISAWFLLLVGFLVGTIGDLEFRYHHTLGAEYLENSSSVLWITSFMIIAYALYRHQKSI